MQIPSLLYGPRKTVTGRARTAARKLLQGKSLAEVVGSAGLDPATTEGLIVLSGEPQAQGPQFFVDAVLEAFRDAWGDARYDALEAGDQARVTELDALEEDLFAQSLKRDWGVLGLLGQGGQFWFLRFKPDALSIPDVLDRLEPAPDRYRPFVRAVQRYWPEYVALGDRYTSSGWDATGKPVWQTFNSATYVLANLGDPAPQLGPEGFSIPEGIRA